MLALVRTFAHRLKAVLSGGTSDPEHQAAGRERSAGPHTIPATCHSDDYLHEVRFDAAPWFERASDEDILELAGIDWGGDYAADEVARFAEDTDEGVAALFDYLARRPILASGDTVGFECHVEAEAVLRWLKQCRPALFMKVCALTEGVPDGQA